MVMEVEDTRFGERGTLFMADCGVIPEPNVEQLADIAVSTTGKSPDEAAADLLRAVAVPDNRISRRSA